MPSLSLSVVVGLAVLLAIPRLRDRLRRHYRSRRLGCLPARKYPHTHLLGFDLYQARVDAVKAGRRNDFDLELFQKYGTTYEERAMLGKIINTTDTANFQAVGATQFEHFGRSARRAAEPFFGHGILSMHGSQWRQARDLVTPLFKRAELMDIERFKRYVDRMFDRLPRDGSTVDLQPLLQKLFLDSSTEFIFGESIDSLRDTTTASDDFLQAFNLALAGAGKRLSMEGVFSFVYMFDTSWKRSYSKVHAFIDARIKRYSEEHTNHSTDKTNTKQRYVLMDGMAQVIKDPVELRFQLLNIFFPARDTSAVLASNALFFLARSPHLWTELRADALAVSHEPMTFELLKSLHSFRYTLFEAIRLRGPSGQVRRVALRDTTLPRGGGPDGSAPLFVPKGTGVYLNNFPKMRDVAIWGEDVDAFRPSRFEGKVLGWEFTPFFGGPRICPAVNQVITQSVYLLVRLVLEFEMIENQDECLEYVEATRMLVESRNGVKVALHPSCHVKGEAVPA